MKNYWLILVIVGFILVALWSWSSRKSNISSSDLDVKLDERVEAEKKTEKSKEIRRQEVATNSADTIKQDRVLVDLNTSKGVIRLELFPKEAPKTVANFLAKAKEGYYNNLTFHRVEDWVIQGGDPLGNGTGGGSIPTELSKLAFKVGSLGVARAGDIKVSNDSQFFICKTDCSFLTGQYTNFGQVVFGMDVVSSIEIGDKIIGINKVED